jgi:regulatory protein
VLETDERLELALAAAYAYLNRRERTRAEVRGHLEGKGFAPRDVERSIESLVESGYLDDERFARLFVQDKRELEQWGSERIRQGLLSRGIDRDLTEAALTGEAHDTSEEIGRAVALLRRRFPSPTWDRRERDRALGMLIRKGYASELALDAIASYARGDGAA